MHATYGLSTVSTLRYPIYDDVQDMEPCSRVWWRQVFIQGIWSTVLTTALHIAHRVSLYGYILPLNFTPGLMPDLIPLRTITFRHSGWRRAYFLFHIVQKWMIVFAGFFSKANSSKQWYAALLRWSFWDHKCAFRTWFGFSNWRCVKGCNYYAATSEEAKQCLVPCIT